jgi:hypothetical protein
MRIEVEINTDTAAFLASGGSFERELGWVLSTIQNKVLAQMRRPPAKCDAAEDADVVRDSNGSRVGTIKVTGDLPESWRRHSFAWTGIIPCTGQYKCRWCGKVADAHSLDYSKVDREELCPKME